MTRAIKILAILILLVVIGILFMLMPAEGGAQQATPTVPPIWVTEPATMPAPYPPPATVVPPSNPYPGPGPVAPAQYRLYLPIVNGGWK